MCRYMDSVIGQLEFNTCCLKIWISTQVRLSKGPDVFLYALADLGGAPGMHPTKGPDSFVLTYKFYET